MATHVVTAPMIVVRNDKGEQTYLNRGVELPDWVDKDHLAQLKKQGQVEAQRAKKATVVPPAGSSGDGGSSSSDGGKPSTGDGSDSKPSTPSGTSPTK